MLGLSGESAGRTVRDGLRTARDRVTDGMWWLRLSKRSARRGAWLLRIWLGVALVLYALSFVGPTPVDHRPIAYESPGAVATDAVHNLRTATYRVSVEATRTGADGVQEPLLESTRTIDNRAHMYASTRRTGSAVGNRSMVPERRYGTYTTGFERPESTGGTDWQRADRHRYHPGRNAFESVAALREADAVVVTDAPDTYTVRVTDRAAVAEVVSLPNHDQRRGANWTASLQLVVGREGDRLRRAEYRYRAPDSGLRVDATYRFTYGHRVDVDRPLATYPPGDETIARLDLGLHALETHLGGILP